MEESETFVQVGTSRMEVNKNRKVSAAQTSAYLN
jgi:hypothetical protein